MLRNILAVVLGVIAGGIVVAIIEMIGHRVYPVAPGIDMSDPKAMAEFIKGLPVGAFLFVLAAYAGGSFTAGAISTLIATQKKVLFAMICGGILMLGGIMNLIAIPHPLWMTILTILIFLPFAWLGFTAAAGFKKNAN